MDNWISVNDSLPELTEIRRVGHELHEYNEKDSNLWGEFIVDHVFKSSVEVLVAEQKGDDFEEDVGTLMPKGWASDCDNVTHWKPK